MKALVVIPARLGSIRLPNKPLLKINGVSMIRRTVQKVLASGLSPVAVAVDSPLILKEVEDLSGVYPVMTSKDHTCGTERVLEAYHILSKKLGSFDVIVNVQGDEPFIEPSMLSQMMIELEKRKDRAQFWTTVTDLPKTDLEDRNVAKVVLDLKGNALIFTRDDLEQSFKHTSVYIYTPEFLERFCALSASPLEKAYRLEQMRALDHGYPCNCIYLPFDSISINSIEDLEKAGIKDYQIVDPA